MPKPKPSALKGEIPANEPKPTGVPKCPSHLDKIAKAEWKRTSKALEELGLLTAIDGSALAAYCQTYSRWVAAELNIQKYGLVVKSPKSGYPVNSPYVGIANKALAEMRKFMVELGMSPSSRVRLARDNFDAKSELDALMAGGDEDEDGD